MMLYYFFYYCQFVIRFLWFHLSIQNMIMVSSAKSVKSQKIFMLSYEVTV